MKRIFSYISQEISKIQNDYLNEKNVFIYGDHKSGKTTLVNYINELLCKNNQFKVLKLIGNPQSKSEYSCFHATVHSVGVGKIYTMSALDVIGLLPQINSYNIKNILNTSNTVYNYKLVGLNSIEKDILSRIIQKLGSKKLILIIDNVEYIDQQSLSLLSKMFDENYQDRIGISKGSIIITSNSKLKDNKIEFIKKLKFNEHYINQPPSIDVESQFHSIFNTHLDNETVKSLISLTNNSMGLIAQILDLKTETINLRNLQSNQFDNYNELISEILKIRLNDTEIVKHNIRKLLDIASIVGEPFNNLLISSVTNDKPYITEEKLNLATNKNFTSKVSFDYLFANKLYQKYFLSNLSENKLEYTHLYSEAMKKYYPFDYYRKYQAFELAEQYTEAFEQLLIYCIRMKFKGSHINNENFKYLKDSFRICNIDFFEIYIKASDAIDCYFSDNKTLNRIKIDLMTIDTINIPEIKVELDFLYCLLVYHRNATEHYQETLMILENYYSNPIDNIDQKLRINSLLLLFYVNRIGDFSNARKVEIESRRVLLKQMKINADYEFFYRTLDRISPAIYEYEIALIWISKSIEYFSKNISIYYNEFIIALTNYIGVYTVLGETVPSSKISSFIEIADEYKSITHRSKKYLNNFYLYNFIFNFTDLTVTIKRFKELHNMKQKGASKIVHLNLTSLLMIQNEYKSANDMFEIFDELYKEHNDYYIYFRNFNLIIYQILLGNHKRAQKKLVNLNGLVPAICQSFTTIIRDRYELIKAIIDNSITFSNYNELHRFFISKLEQRTNSVYWKHPVILSDAQYWSLF